MEGLNNFERHVDLEALRVKFQKELMDYGALLVSMDLAQTDGNKGLETDIVFLGEKFQELNAAVESGDELKADTIAAELKERFSEV